LIGPADQPCGYLLRTDQCPARVGHSFFEAGAAKVFAEKISGASAGNRKALARALRTVQPGDVLLVTRPAWRFPVGRPRLVEF
jgi:hypothetical protein